MDYSMSSLLTKYSSCFPYIVATILFLAVLFTIYWLFTKQRSTFWTIVVTAIFVAIFIFAFKKYIMPKVSTFTSSRGKSNEIFIYDTDPRNDEFIKGSLKKVKQKKLDYVLMKEKDACGLRLSNQFLYQFSNNDNDIIAGYNRWRKCKEMRRSYHRVIYPDERKIYLQSR
jgi:hypothetical protein